MSSRRMMKHRATVEYTVPGNPDEWGKPTATQMVTTVVPCLFWWVDLASSGEQRSVRSDYVVSEPRMIVPKQVDVRVGYVIRNVEGKDGEVIEADPHRVANVGWRQRHQVIRLDSRAVS